MMNKIQLIFLCGFMFFSLQLQAQYTSYKAPYQVLKKSQEVQLHLGASTFLGDLGGTKGKGAPFIKDFNAKTIRPFLGASFSYYPNDWLNVNGGINFTWINGADSIIETKTGNARGRYQRNLSFRSNIKELNANVEIYPLQLIKKYQYGKLLPFLGAGLGVFHFNPKAPLNGDWIKLHPLHLEGEGFAEYPGRKNYKLTKLYIPFTAGIKYRISDGYLLSLKAIFRATGTDFLDDVSTTYIDPSLFDKYLPAADAALAKQLYYRGTPGVTPTDKARGENGKDSYTSVVVTLGYLFKKSKF